MAHLPPLAHSCPPTCAGSVVGASVYDYLITGSATGSVASEPADWRSVLEVEAVPSAAARPPNTGEVLYSQFYEKGLAAPSGGGAGGGGGGDDGSSVGPPSTWSKSKLPPAPPPPPPSPRVRYEDEHQQIRYVGGGAQARRSQSEVERSLVSGQGGDLSLDDFRALSKAGRLTAVIVPSANTPHSCRLDDDRRASALRVPLLPLPCAAAAAATTTAAAAAAYSRR